VRTLPRAPANAGKGCLGLAPQGENGMRWVLKFAAHNGFSDTFRATIR
jgi:hypothetical protein